jgi:hypothetical protein
MSTPEATPAPAPARAGASSAALAPRTVRLAALLEQHPRSTVRLAELWELWAAADPAGAGRAERRTHMAAAIGELAAAGLATPSKRVDRSAHPHLPTQLTLPSPAPSATAGVLARSTVWRPELSWAVSARLTVGQVGTLRAVNTWLRDHGHETDLLPLRERSLEVLSHEKTFDKTLATTLFGPGRLTLDLLRTFQTHPPLAGTRVSDGPVLLVVENDATFHSVRAALSTDSGPVGHVAWGAGGAFEASIRSAGDLSGITRVRYFGDIDADGLRIPCSAAATAEREGLPPVLPATSLYRMLLDTKVRQYQQPPVSGDGAFHAARWLGSRQLVEEVTTLLDEGTRVPQEALRATMLAADRQWRDNL